MPPQEGNELADFSDGFWREFFLLRPDKASLQRRLEAIDAEDLLQIQVLEYGILSQLPQLKETLLGRDTAAIQESRRPDNLQEWTFG